MSNIEKIFWVRLLSELGEEDLASAVQATEILDHLRSYDLDYIKGIQYKRFSNWNGIVDSYTIWRSHWIGGGLFKKIAHLGYNKYLGDSVPKEVWRKAWEKALAYVSMPSKVTLSIMMDPEEAALAIEEILQNDTPLRVADIFSFDRSREGFHFWYDEIRKPKLSKHTREFLGNLKEAVASASGRDVVLETTPSVGALKSRKTKEYPGYAPSVGPGRRGFDATTYAIEELLAETIRDMPNF